MKETPAILSSNYTNTTIDPGSIWRSPEISPTFNVWEEWKKIQRLGQEEEANTPIPPHLLRNQPLIERTVETMASANTRRIVQVFIADTDLNVPLDESLIFKGDQKLTDLTDTELFFEVPIAELLNKHNAKRATWLDKEASKRAGKDIFLEPTRIRELKMVVVTVAQF